MTFSVRTQNISEHRTEYIRGPWNKSYSTIKIINRNYKKNEGKRHIRAVITSKIYPLASIQDFCQNYANDLLSNLGQYTYICTLPKCLCPHASVVQSFYLLLSCNSTSYCHCHSTSCCPVILPPVVLSFYLQLQSFYLLLSCHSTSSCTVILPPVVQSF